MGELIEYQNNGDTCSGYLATPTLGSGPGVIVLQEWWGLVDQIKEVADRFAEEGFVALAPDMYHGETANNPNDAKRLFMALNIDRVEKDLRSSIEYLLLLDQTQGNLVGTVGFCMGGQLSLYAACANSQVGACVNYYGVHPSVHPDINNLKAPVLGFFGENDESVPPETVHKLEDSLKQAGKQVDFYIYPGAGHAFFNNTRPMYKEKESEESWRRMIQFYRTNLTKSS